MAMPSLGRTALAVTEKITQLDRIRPLHQLHRTEALFVCER